MAKIRSISLGKLERQYQTKIRELTAKKEQLQKQLQALDRELRSYQGKLHHVQALVGSEAKPAAVPPARPARTRGGRQRRKRSSPVKTATLQALRNRPGQVLTVRQLVSAIRQDTNRRVSRQAVDVNVDRLEAEGLIKRLRAPKGTRAHFAFTAV